MKIAMGLIVFFLLGFVGGSPASPIPFHLKPKDHPLLFPTRVGTHWTYTIDDEDRDFFISDSAPTPTGHILTIMQERPNQKNVMAWKLRVHSSGIEEIENIQGVIDPPSVWIRVPCTEGKSWRSEFTALDFHSIWERRMVGTKEYSIDSHKCTAIGIQSEHIGPKPKNGLRIAQIQETRWYAPSIGIVEITGTNSSSTWQLKHFKPRP